MITADGIISDNLSMTRPASAPLRRVLGAPFTRRAWAELAYAVVSALLAVGALMFIVPMLANGLLWGLSAPGDQETQRGAAAFLARELLGEDVPASPRLRSVPYFKVRMPNAAQLAVIANKAGGRTRVWDGQPGITVRKLPPGPDRRAGRRGGPHDRCDRAGQRGAELARRPGSSIQAPGGPAPTSRSRCRWPGSAWRSSLDCWLGGLFFLTFPAWRALGVPSPSLAISFLLIPAGAAMLLAAPWLVHGTSEADRRLIRTLLGPSSPAERIRALEESRARVVDDSAARLRGIERDLHDGTQAQLVALAMKLGLAQQKLHGSAPVDLARITQLVDDAHRRAVEAIADVRTLARGIHPAMLDNGLTDALGTLAARSALPVELVTDIPERPSAAIETIAYYLGVRAADQRGQAQRRPARYPRGRARPRPAADPRHRRRPGRRLPRPRRRPARAGRTGPYRGRPHPHRQPGRRPHGGNRGTAVPRLKAR